MMTPEQSVEFWQDLANQRRNILASELREAREMLTTAECNEMRASTAAAAARRKVSECYSALEKARLALLQHAEGVEFQEPVHIYLTK